VRKQFDVRVLGFFQAPLDLRSKPSIVLGAFDIIPHEVAQQLGAMPATPKKVWRAIRAARVVR
jgi:hypothetical protein